MPPEEKSGQITLDAHKILTTVLLLAITFLSGWVWDMEKRMTVQEADGKWEKKIMEEIKADVADIKKELLGQ